MKAIHCLLLCVAVASAVQICAAQDAQGCKDSPLIILFDTGKAARSIAAWNW